MHLTGSPLRCDLPFRRSTFPPFRPSAVPPFGQITFGKAFKVGILITLIASGIYVIGWMIYFYTSDVAQSFPAQYMDYMREQWASSGMSEQEIREKAAGYEKNMEMYKNPIIMAGITLMEVLPVGLLITLISAFILKKK